MSLLTRTSHWEHIENMDVGQKRTRTVEENNMTTKVQTRMRVMALSCSLKASQPHNGHEQNQDAYVQ